MTTEIQGDYRGGLDWKEIGISGQEAVFLARRELDLRSFASIFGIRPIVAGNLPEASSYAAARLGRNA